MRISMKRKLICVLLCIGILSSVFMTGCGQKGENKYIGTWRADTVGTILNYLVFDENGYWEVFIIEQGLAYGMSENPDVFTSFDDFVDGATFPGITDCRIEYHAGAGYTDSFTITEDNRMINAVGTEYRKVSDHSGSIDGDLRARIEAIYTQAKEDAAG